MSFVDRPCVDGACLDSYCDTLAPTELQSRAKAVVRQLVESFDQQQAIRFDKILSASPQLGPQLIKALVGSEYLLLSCCRYPDLLFHWLLTDVPFAPLTPVKIIDSVDAICVESLTVEAFDQQLRQLRRRLITGVYWRDLNRLADFAEVSLAMTIMAEALVQKALDFHYRLLSEKHGLPLGSDSQQPQSLLVIGMGKLGGGELNVSSDIDLLFVFPESGNTDHKTRSIENQQFFNLLGQRLIKSLSEVTADGFVFRVDMRLRPYGQSGSLTSNFAALENYYQTQGRDWERFACIKARVIAVSDLVGGLGADADNAHQSLVLAREATQQCERILLPFVYRKYIDFSLVESLRQLKALIVQEVKRKGLHDHIKLGAGGIREIEFIAQSFQLIRGGVYPQLQQRNLLRVLDELKQLQLLDAVVIDKLASAYHFLRTTEHAIQAYQDAQTQLLPESEGVRAILAWVMGFDDWAGFLATLDAHRQWVSTEFQKLIADPDQGDQSILPVAKVWQDVWLRTVDESAAVFAEHGFTDSVTVAEQLQRFLLSRNISSLSASAREKLDQLMPLLLQRIVDAKHVLDPSLDQSLDLTLKRLLQWLEAIVTRTSYIVLLLENPQTLTHLVRLFTASSWVAQTLAQMPSLLDELLSPQHLYTLPEKAALRDELRQRLLRIEPRDVESNMEALRYFRLAHNLHVAACEVAGSLPLMKVSDYLSFTAEVVLEQVLQLTWYEMTQRHGYPAGATDAAPRFLIVGYGKLGGIEMSYSSDLDLVFIYDAELQGMTDGDKPLDNQTFYTRLGQKIIHMLNTRTLSGQLYEVDMRLRPSGNSGLLVSSLKGFERYQRQDAWVWEHQALVRARPVAGDAKLAQQFVQLRQQILQLPRNSQSLRDEVIKMREKMRSHLGSPDRQSSAHSGNNSAHSENNSPHSENKDTAAQRQFHLKQDAGGIVDIEFMVQYAVLAWGHEQPALTEWTDNIRLLESLQQSGLIDAEQADQLIAIYQSYRTYSHRLALQQEPSAIIEGGLFIAEREQVCTLWQQLLG